MASLLILIPNRPEYKSEDQFSRTQAFSEHQTQSSLKSNPPFIQALRNLKKYIAWMSLSRKVPQVALLTAASPPLEASRPWR